MMQFFLSTDNILQDELKQLAKGERIAIHASNVANMVLFISKVYASIDSRSMAVISSTLDSLLDLLSGFILWFTSNAMKTPNQYRYPIGKKRMQPVVSLLTTQQHSEICVGLPYNIGLWNDLLFHYTVFSNRYLMISF